MNRINRFFKIFVSLLVFALACPGIGRAEEQTMNSDSETKSEEAQRPSLEEARKSSPEERLEELKAKETKMRQAEVNMQNEAQEFNQMQARFCADYHLDSTKFTRGLYIYDARKGEFTLKEEEKQPEASENKE